MCRSLQAWKCVGEELPVCCAEAVAPGGIPVTLAAAPAEQTVRAGGAFCRTFAALRQKAERFSTVIDPARIAQVALSYES